MSMKEIRMTVNGRAVKILTDPKKTLLKVIRDELRLLGTKEGCGEGVCGCCTVLLDGQPVNSCKIAVEKAQGRSVTTIEGIGSAEKPDDIQRAFVKAGAAQCGFCTPGMILTAKYILEKNPDPTREEVKQGLRRNLCRCTGYEKIVDAVMLAAKGKKDRTVLEMKALGEYRIGDYIPQLDSWEKVTGSLRYTQDIYIENMCFAKTLRSPHAHAKIVSIDATQAEAMPGVVCVCTYKDLQGVNRVKYIFQDFRALADDKVRYLNEPVAIVVAKTEELAQAALEKIQVDYEVLPSVHDPFEAMKEGAPEVQEEYPENLLFTQNLVHGDADAAFAEADLIEEHDYYTPSNAHGYLEPDAGVGYIDDEGRVVVYSCGQAAHYHRTELCRVLGLGTDEIRVVEDVTGAGFGGRIDPFVQLLIGIAVYKARVPVKMMFTTEEDFTATAKRHPFWMHMKTGVKKDGTLVAHYGEIVSDAGAYALASPGVLIRAIIHSYGPYACKNVKVLGKMILTNNVPNAAMRGFGSSQMCFAMEMQVNRICEKLGISLIDFVRKNGFRQGTVTATGQLLEENPGFIETAELIDQYWKQREHRYTDPQELAKLPPHIKRGKGFATAFHGIGKTGAPQQSLAHAAFMENGMLDLREGAADIGQGSNTTMALIACEELDMGLDRIQLTAADTLKTPDADVTCASRHTYYTGNAVMLAARQVKEKMLAAGAKELGVPVDEVATKDAQVFVVKRPECQISAGELVKKGYDLSGDGQFRLLFKPIDRESGQGKQYEVYTFGTCGLEIEVDTKTGKVKVLDAALAFQCGRAINRLVMEGQVESGVVQGMAYALSEEYFPNGGTTSFKQYKMPRSNEIPEMHSFFVEVPQGSGPFGAIGMSEPAHFPMAPAIMSALHEACGIWIDRLPATPERILAALAEKQNEN